MVLYLTPKNGSPAVKAISMLSKFSCVFDPVSRSSCKAWKFEIAACAASVKAESINQQSEAISGHSLGSIDEPVRYAVNRLLIARMFITT